MGVLFRVLGPVEAVADGGPIDLGHARQQCVFVTLLVEANRVVSVDALLDRAWGAEPPLRGRDTLYSYLSRLRRVLPEDEVTVERRRGGYALIVDPDAVDLHRFRALVCRARAADGATALFDEALGLWRGEPFGALDTPWLAGLRETLARERFTAMLDRNDAALAEGEHAAVLPDLLVAAAEHPLDERLACQLMLALCRAGRQAEALGHFEQVRGLLAEELGVDPGPELRALHESMLRGEIGAPARVVARTRRNDLPGDLADFTGRTAELEELLAAIPDDPAGTAMVIETIDGMAGIGKTSLAVHVAHRLAARYPDGQLFVDLRGHVPDGMATDPMHALETLLRAIDVPADRIPPDQAERSALWRAEVADRRMLVVLDDAADSAQVRPLLPGGAGCLTLITSRRSLIDLPAARVLSLDVLPTADAVALFGRIVGAERAEREPDAVAEVVRLCGRLPLAIRVAAGRLRSRPTWSVRHLADRLALGHQRLSELDADDRGVAAMFELSYRQLPPDQGRLYRLLGISPCPDFDVHAAAALAGARPEDADRMLEALVDVHLLAEPAPGRYRFHDLLRHHAGALARQSIPEPELTAALTRLFDYHLHTAAAATEHLGPHAHPVEPTRPPDHAPALADRAAALSWLDSERANLAEVVRHAAEHEWHKHAWQLPMALWRFYFQRGHLHDWITTHHLAMTAATALGDRSAQAVTLKALGTAQWQARRFPEALEHYQRALDLYRAIGDQRGEAAVLGNMGLIFYQTDRYPEAIEHHRRDLDLCLALGDRRGEATTLSNLGLAYERIGRYPEALDHCARALALIRELGDRWLEGATLIHIGIIHTRMGDHAEATAAQQTALALMRDLGDREREGQVLANLGMVHNALGDHDTALAHLRQALAIAREVGDRCEECTVLNDLGTVHLAVGDPEEALAAHRAALDLALAIPDRYQQGRAHHGIGAALGRDDRAHWRRALEIYADLGVPEADEVRAALSAGTVSIEE
ncbi:AfsR/SARP family transcriptional regulator [Actinokineospora fastidiosa]|uniref:SARP family transcriptional regulator n=1 Tax=Actinokineospora fastidiosa TaxID=1816 RepID=A0A918LJF6_9PSEU|nr:tetratricopeptide repeat protein [Actinokineospora fastidiosa]GGS60077.1 SARP family transcriptional regulator [Actinokineospora fastidiosa]